MTLGENPHESHPIRAKLSIVIGACSTWPFSFALTRDRLQCDILSTIFSIHLFPVLLRPLLESGNPCQNLAGALVGFIDPALILHSAWCFEHRQHATYSPNKNTSTLADPGHLPADLELGRLYVKDLRSLCSRLNLLTTGGRAALIKRIDEARLNTANLSGTPPPIQDGGEHMANQPALEMQLQQLQRQVQELLDRESPADGLLSAPQLSQVQSIVQGSLNEAIEKAASAAAQAAVRAFSGSHLPAPAPAILAGESSVDVTPTSSTASTSINIKLKSKKLL